MMVQVVSVSNMMGVPFLIHTQGVIARLGSFSEQVYFTVDIRLQMKLYRVTADLAIFY